MKTPRPDPAPSVRLALLLALGLLPLFATAAPPAPDAMAAGSPHVVLQAAQMTWGDGPAFLPKGVKIAVLSGDPAATGTFVLRLKAPANGVIPMHWHPADEHVTVIEGDLTVSTDDGAAPQALDAGGYALMPARMHHQVRTQGGAVVQVSGTGPFAITYVDPATDPRNAGK
jgi:quercetin dioxygenase-like cupin family protein